MLVLKMKAVHVSRTNYGGDDTQESLRFDAVYSEDPNSVNRAWSRATPSAHLSVHISNLQAQGRIENGAEYIVTIRPATPEE